MMGRSPVRRVALAALAAASLCLASQAWAVDSVSGRVLAAGAPVVNSTVTLWMASAGAPAQLAQAKTDAAGHFALTTDAARDKDAVLYLVAKGGEAAAGNRGDDPALALLAVLGSSPPETVTVNELTTVASAYTAARLIDGEAISGNPLGLRIAAGNAPNLADPATGGWGKVLLDPLNSTQTTTLANLNTLGALISAFATVADDAWRSRLLETAAPTAGVIPTNTLQAVAGIAGTPWARPKELFALFDEAYPQPKNPLVRRKAPFAPYLAYVPDDFALSLCFAGGGNYSAGRLMFDAEGNLWSGQNWLA
jgi:hypothetical protein